MINHVNNKKSTITVIDLKNIYIFIARNMLTQKCPYNSIVNNLHTTITLNDGLLTFFRKSVAFYNYFLLSTCSYIY